MEARQLRKRRRAQLEPHVLRGAELALKHKLRRKFSADFTTRHADDLIAKAAKEYVAAEARGERIENPGGFLVDVAYKRAIDALRKESADPELDELEAASSLPDPGVADPSEELEREEVRSQVYEAISHLEGEERQVIALVYFEGMSGRESAGPLGLSETTALRRLRSASAKLLEWLPAIEQGSFCAEAAPQLRALAAGTAEGLEVTQAKLHLENCAACRETMARREAFGFEVGLAAWLSLSGAAFAQARLGDRLAGLAEATRHAVAAATDRARELALRLTGSGGAEAAGGAGGAALGKAAAGACATAAAVCAVTGVIGPGIGGIDLSGGGHEAAAPKASSAKASRAPAPAPAPPVERTPIVASPPTEKHERAKHTRAGGSTSQRSSKTARATAAAAEQFGVESAAGGGESVASSPAPAEASTPSSSSSSSSPTPTQIANEQFGP
jgi:RNA polymerase sigma factor (sigma-70 family)